MAYEWDYPARPEPIAVTDLKDCPGCKVKAGQPHVEGCDIERCSACSAQRIDYCHEAEHDPLFARWTGIWPHDAEAHWVGVDLNQFIIQGFHTVIAVKPDEPLSDTWVCICGNVASLEGFYPCNSEGTQVEPTPEEWTSGWYACARCYRLIDQRTRQVVGVGFESHLLEIERAAIFGSRGQRVGVWIEGGE